MGVPWGRRPESWKNSKRDATMAVDSPSVVAPHHADSCCRSGVGYTVARVTLCDVTLAGLCMVRIVLC